MDIHGYRLNIADTVAYYAPTLDVAYAIALRETEALVVLGCVIASRTSKCWRAARNCQQPFDLKIQAATTCQECGGVVWCDWQPDFKGGGYWLVTCTAQPDDCLLSRRTFTSPNYPLPPETVALYARTA